MASDMKVAIITGSASGIGAALAQRLYSDGWKVAVCDLQQEKGKQVVASLGEHAEFYKLDVTSYAQNAEVFSEVFKRWGRLDAFLANAGHSDRGSIYILGHRDKDEMPPEPALKSIKACYESFLFGTQLAIHFMRKNKIPGGQIIATSTIVSLHPHQTFPEYCGAKAAINQFVRTAAPLLKLKENITMNAVLPGIVPTQAVPQVSLDATNPEHLTPVETIVNGYLMFLNDKSLNGQLVEGSQDKLFVIQPLAMANGEATKRACTVWEPLFESKHYEKSGLPEAIQ